MSDFRDRRRDGLWDLRESDILKITYIVNPEDGDVPICGLGDDVERFLDQFHYIEQVTIDTDGEGHINFKVIGTLETSPDVLTSDEITQDIKLLPLEYLATYSTIQSVCMALSIWRSR